LVWVIDIRAFIRRFYKKKKKKKKIAIKKARLLTFFEIFEKKKILWFFKNAFFVLKILMCLNRLFEGGGQGLLWF
jgi:hypothetical protein